MADRATNLALLNEYVQNPGLQRHMFAVEAALRAYAVKFGEDVEQWGTVGLLHDFDYERWPNPPDHPLQGALAEYLAIPAVNVVKIESDLPIDQAALTEPLGCIVHSCDMLQRVPARYTFGGERPIRSVLVCGAGPAGLLFTQYLREVVGFDGLLLLTEPNERRRALARGYGATVIDPTSSDLIETIRELTRGEMINCLIESAGIGKLFIQMPSLIRKQATILLYGHGHHGVDLGVLNRLQFIEPTFIAPTGASGPFETDHRPATYRQALKWLSEKRIDVSRFITNRYQTLEDVPRGFAAERFSPDYIKGVAVFE